MVTIRLPLVLRLSPLLVAAACATDPAASSAEASEKVVCGKEEPTGSRMRVQRCWSQEERADEGRDARSALDRAQTLRRPPPPSSNTPSR